LKRARSGKTGSPTGSDTKQPTIKPTPLASTTVVDRVKQAESDFASAQGAVTDQTPVAQASQQFNAAVVALEFAWLRLFADAGCVTGDQQQAEAAVRDYTTSIQQALATAGYYDGEVDGVYGPETVAAVEDVQEAHGLPLTGVVDKATADVLETDLRELGGQAADEALATTAAVQQTLKLAGFWDGPVDGNWTPALTEAVKAFQTDLGVAPTGSVDVATVRAVETAIAEARAPETPSGSPESPSSTQPSVEQPSGTP
jgi:murein L,D-transpeptidase YcbB/YkuD